MLDRARLVTLCECRDFMAESLGKPIGLEDLAKHAGYSPFHLHRLFRDAFNQTPHEFLTRERLAKARTLLRTTDLPVWMIGLEAGYNSNSTFVGWFKTHTGCTPTQYREDARSSFQLGRLWAPRFIPTCFYRRARLND
jgi:AraC family transcriptional regulator